VVKRAFISIRPSARAGFADDRRREWRHGFSDRHGHDFGLLLLRALIKRALPAPA
jgi:hypothetical protein